MSLIQGSVQIVGPQVYTSWARIDEHKCVMNYTYSHIAGTDLLFAAPDFCACVSILYTKYTFWECANDKVFEDVLRTSSTNLARPHDLPSVTGAERKPPVHTHENTSCSACASIDLVQCRNNTPWIPELVAVQLYLNSLISPHFMNIHMFSPLTSIYGMS